MFRLEIATVSELSYKGTWNQHSQFKCVMLKIECLKTVAAINIKLWILLTIWCWHLLEYNSLMYHCRCIVYVHGNISISNIQPIRTQFLCRVLEFLCRRVHGCGWCTSLHNCRQFLAFIDEPIMNLDCDNWASFWFHVDDKQDFCGQLCSPVGNIMNCLLTNKEPKLDRIILDGCLTVNLPY